MLLYTTIEIMINDKANKVIQEFFDLLKNRYQKNWNY